MNVSNNANLARLFQQNNIFQQAKARSSIPANDVLKRLSDNLVTAQDQTEDMKKRFDRLELSTEAMGKAERSPLEEMEEGVLEYFLHLSKCGMMSTMWKERSLTEYRNQLSAYDKTIQDYQDILDGKTALPDQMKMEDILQLQEAVKAARETFLQEGAEELNRISAEGTGLNLYGSAYDVLAPEGSQVNERWNIDPSADDIYGEIDRALATTHKMLSIYEGIGNKVLNELKRRGVHPPEEKFLSRSDFKDWKCQPLFEDIYENIRRNFWKSVSDPGASC